MQIDKKTNTEEMRIEHFVRGDKSMMLNTIQIQVPFESSTYAVAAMIKGLEEFFHKPASMAGDPEVMEQCNHNLKIWEQLSANGAPGADGAAGQNNQKSSLIIAP